MSSADIVKRSENVYRCEGFMKQRTIRIGSSLSSVCDETFSDDDTSVVA